eukprot:gene10321-12666_t
MPPKPSGLVAAGTTTTTTTGTKKDNNKPSKETTTTTTTTTNNNNNNNGKRNFNDKNNNNNNNKPTQQREDKEYDAIQLKIDNYNEDIKKIKIEKDVLREQLAKARGERSEFSKTIGDLINDQKSSSQARKPLIDQLKAARAVLKQLQDEREAKKVALEQMKLEITNVKINSKSTIEGTILTYETKIKEVEKQVEEETNVVAQRSLIKKQSLLNKEKQKIIEVFNHQTIYESYKKKVSDQNELIKELSKKLDDATPDSNSANTAISGAKTQRTDVESKISQMSAQFEVLKNKIKDIHELIEQEKKRKAEYLEQRAIKRKEQQAKAAEERKEREKKRKEEQKLLEEKRELEELQKVPYEEQMDICDSLLIYLEVITPKEAKEATVTTRAVAEKDSDEYEVYQKEPMNKGRGNTKKSTQTPKVPAQTDVIKHPLETFTKFEKISMAPPHKFADIPTCATQLKAKKDHYKNLSDKEIVVRKAKLEESLKAAAEAQAKSETTTTTTTTESVDSSESTPSAVTPETSEQPTTVEEVEAQ